MVAVRVLLGILIGFAVPFGAHFGLLMGLGVSATTSAIVGAVIGGIGAVYTAIAFAKNVYKVGALSIIGLALDLSWSMLNTVASLVWLIACKAVGANFQNDDNTRRSGTFAYDKNPRGGGYDATTIGTVIGGGWCSHEETHVWQSRIFGPLYMLSYVLCLGLNIVFRAVIGKTADIVMQAYYRICFEDQAYWGGTMGADIRWGGWVGGFFLCLLYVGVALLIPIGIAVHNLIIPLVGAGMLVVYSLVRAIAPGH